MILDNIHYGVPNLTSYESRLRVLETKGFRRVLLATTTYGYNVSMYSIGNGDKDLFIVGGTHSNEIISPDFVLQLMEHIDEFEEFDKDLFTIHFIPIQNPEGFDVSTSLLHSISEENLGEKGEEFRTKYLFDVFIHKVFEKLNTFVDSLTFHNDFLTFMKTDDAWLQLKKRIPKISLFYEYIKNAPMPEEPRDVSILINACNISLYETSIEKDKYLLFPVFLDKMRSFFTKLMEKDLPKEDYKRKLTKEDKLHQSMFADIDISTLPIRNHLLRNSIKEVYTRFPDGALVENKTTGSYVDLNKNQPYNRGRTIIRSGDKVFLNNAPRSNIQNYCIGPMGIPCLDNENFTYALENQVLLNLLKKSEKEGRYIGTLLYHGVGGIIFYKPCEKVMEQTKYNEILPYNQTIMDAYIKGTEEYDNSKAYKPVTSDPEYNGFGDMLRAKYKGVLLIELSKVGYNPIGPYTTEDNIYDVVKQNFSGIRELLRQLKLEYDIKKRLYRK